VEDRHEAVPLEQEDAVGRAPGVQAGGEGHYTVVVDRQAARETVEGAVERRGQRVAGPGDERRHAAAHGQHRARPAEEDRAVAAAERRPRQDGFSGPGKAIAPLRHVHPEVAFTVGQLHVAVSSHALAVAAGVAAGFVLALRRARDPAVVLAAAAAMTVAALAGAHGLFRAMHGGDERFWNGGLASTGGVAAGVIAAWVTAWVAGRPLAELLDALAPAGVLALAIGRLGCFLAGCCYGRPSELPWAVVFPELGAPARHPL